MPFSKEGLFMLDIQSELEVQRQEQFRALRTTKARPAWPPSSRSARRRSIDMKAVGLLALAVGLAGCANLKPDYVAPASGPTATVEVADAAGVINRRVLVHGADICSGEQARLVGIVKSKAIGIDYVEKHVITVEANKPVAISMPWSGNITTEGTKLKISYCQPVVVFTPAEGRRYRLDFESCSAILTDDRGVGRQAPIYQGCDQGPPEGDPSRMFFLRPKK
jgi:hypothetical protein